MPSDFPAAPAASPIAHVRKLAFGAAFLSVLGLLLATARFLPF